MITCPTDWRLPLRAQLFSRALLRICASLIDDWKSAVHAYSGAGTTKGFSNSGTFAQIEDTRSPIELQFHTRRRGRAAHVHVQRSTQTKPNQSPSILIMFRPRKSKPPADTSNPTPPAELVRDLTSRKDPRTLFATSTAVALSLGSAFRDTRDTVNDGATIRGRDTGWQTAYGAARIAVEIANETSDMFLPLKAVVGAISILIKNYDVSVACSRIEHLLIFSPFPTPANIGQRGGCEGDRTEGAVAVWRAYLSSGRERLCREREESGASEVRTYTSI